MNLTQSTKNLHLQASQMYKVNITNLIRTANQLRQPIWVKSDIKNLLNSLLKNSENFVQIPTNLLASNNKVTNLKRLQNKS